VLRQSRHDRHRHPRGGQFDVMTHRQLGFVFFFFFFFFDGETPIWGKKGWLKEDQAPRRRLTTSTPCLAAMRQRASESTASSTRVAVSTGESSMG